MSNLRSGINEGQGIENSQEKLYVGTLASGEKVYDRPNGHIHETIKDDLGLAIAEKRSLLRKEIIETVTLEGKEWKSFKVSISENEDYSNLFLARRKGRAGLTPFIKNREPGVTDKITYILSKNDIRRGVPEGYSVMTAFSGDLAKREPWDAYFTSGVTDADREKRKLEQEESLAYWSKYAFVPDEIEFPIDEDTVVPYDPKLLGKPFYTEKEKGKQIRYSGLFVVDAESLIKEFSPKHVNVYAHHSTLFFAPKNSNGLEIGKKQKLKIIGRAYDDKGDALLVENVKSSNKHPHITLSCREGISPVYSNELIEKAIADGTVTYFDQPVFIDVVEGYENGNNKVVADDKYLVS